MKNDFLSLEENTGIYKKYVKRVLSVLLGIFACPFVVLSFIIFAPIIKFTDGGTVFYKDKRLGLNGKAFTMFKYRSMKMNSGVIRASDGVSTIKDKSDSRITKIGRFIRKYGIDELPQVWNIIKGDMSFIGPRPDFPDTIDRLTGVIPNPIADITPDDFYENYYKARMSVRPGITSYAVIKLPDDANRVMCDEADAWYARNMTFGLDVNLFFGTIFHLVLGKHK